MDNVNVNNTRKTICLSMIVKNESHVIERCLTSVFKHIDYWVISDTGSTDNTKEKIQDFFDKKGTWILQNNPRHWSDIDGHLLDDDDFREVLNACVHKLPEMWSIAIQFKYLKGKNANEICQELEISTSNYWQIIHRAKLHLRKCLELNWFKK